MSKVLKLLDAMDKGEITNNDVIDILTKSDEKFVNHINNILTEKDQRIAELEEQLNSAQVGEQFALKCCKEAEEQLKNAIVLPFEFDKPFYKLCPKCNNQQEGCKNCAWQMCGFNQCFSVCHSENEGLLIKEIILKKDNCIVSLNALNYIIKNWNKYYFATKEEALAKLKELQGE